MDHKQTVEDQVKFNPVYNGQCSEDMFGVLVWCKPAGEPRPCQRLGGRAQLYSLNIGLRIKTQQVLLGVFGL
ncbi:unnamed protein product, partial [Iphiclides podalirius]